MKNFRKILVVVLALALVFALAACTKDPGSNQGPTSDGLHFEFTVVDLEGSEMEYDVPFTDGQTVGEALLAEELIAGEESEYGLYVKTVSGITLDYDTDGAYWSFYIGNEPAATGVDGEKAVAGANYSFVATKG